MGNLDKARRDIDRIDKELMQLFAQRIKASNEIADYKLSSGMAVYDAARERQVIERAGDRVAPTFRSCAQSFMGTITRISRGVQYEKMLELGWPLGEQLAQASTTLDDVKSVIYQGVKGSYSYQASEKLFPNTEKKAYASFSLACEALANGEADLAVLPLENSTAGTVNDVYDDILKRNLFIIQSLGMNIRHSLSAVPGAKEEDIKQVLSHPQALAQCAGYLRSRGWMPVEFDNTARAASHVAELGDKTLAAISSREAAVEYGLDVLQENVADNPSNTTRFVVLSRKLYILPGADRVSVAFRLPHETGSLSGVLSGLADYGLNLAKIQSRPIVDQPWEYYFYLDFIAQREDSAALIALCRLEKETPFLQFLGWYGEGNT